MRREKYKGRLPASNGGLLPGFTRISFQDEKARRTGFFTGTAGKLVAKILRHFDIRTLHRVTTVTNERKCHTSKIGKSPPYHPRVAEDLGEWIDPPRKTVSQKKTRQGRERYLAQANRGRRGVHH